jgi:hypothetical protein
MMIPTLDRQNRGKVSNMSNCLDSKVVLFSTKYAIFDVNVMNDISTERATVMENSVQQMRQ